MTFGTETMDLRGPRIIVLLSTLKSTTVLCCPGLVLQKIQEPLTQDHNYAIQGLK